VKKKTLGALWISKQQRVASTKFQPATDQSHQRNAAFTRRPSAAIQTRQCIYIITHFFHKPPNYRENVLRKDTKILMRGILYFFFQSRPFIRFPGHQGWSFEEQNVTWVLININRKRGQLPTSITFQEKRSVASLLIER